MPLQRQSSRKTMMLAAFLFLGHNIVSFWQKSFCHCQYRQLEIRPKQFYLGQCPVCVVENFDILPNMMVIYSIKQ